LGSGFRGSGVQGSGVQGFRVQGSGFWVLSSGVQGLRFKGQRRRWPKNGQFNQKKTLKKRITNIEVRYSIVIIFEKRLSIAIPHFVISASGGFDILRFAVPTMCVHTSVAAGLNRSRSY
jgi:hypothetical protein